MVKAAIMLGMALAAAPPPRLPPGPSTALPRPELLRAERPTPAQRVMPGLF